MTFPATTASVGPALSARRHIAMLAIANVGAAAVLITGWGAIDHEGSPGHGIAWLNVAVVAVVIAAVTDLATLAASRRAVLTRRRSIIEDLPTVAVGSAESAEVSSGWVALEGATRAHRPGCILLTAKPAVAVDARALRAAGRRVRRCEVCAR